MESSDVIELNSSDEEAKEPAAKKAKHLSDVMVHIPSKLYQTTIMPARYKQKDVGMSSSTKLRISPNVLLQSTFKNKQNGRQLSKNISRPNEKKLINPLHVASNSKMDKSAAKSITLPPSITVTKTKPATDLKGTIPPKNSYISVKKRKDLDIVPVKVRGASPQWYMRPEDHLNEKHQELLNNKEPEPINMIEITIEDSPIKLPNEAISDDVTHNEHHKSKSPESKKKLDYTEKMDTTSEAHESEPASDIIFKTDTNNVEGILESKETVESQEYPKNVFDESTVKTALKVSDVPEDKSELDNHQNNVRTESVQIPTDKDTGENVGEFHTTYQKFIDLCFELENSDDMRKIVDKKIKTYYKQVSKEYVESEEFLNMVSVKMSLMRASPKDMFVYIKHIVDELNIQRKMVKSQEPEINDVNRKETYDDQHEKKERKRLHQICKLEKTIKKLHKAIQKLEEQEVDFSDEDNSTYVRTERYKERIVRVHAKLCQLTSSRMPSEPYLHIPRKHNESQTLVRKLEKSINRKVPLGTPLPFPDFHDVLKIVRGVNEEEKLGWNETELMEEARDLFTRCGRKLQRRRQHNEWNLMASRITQQGDPADDNEALKNILVESRSEALQKEAEVFKEYVDKQTELKLEGVEIGDKEADESPEESEDEEVNGNSNSLHDKCKKNHLIEDTSKKSAESLEKSEPMSRNKEVSKNVEKIIEIDKSPENTDNFIVTTDTSKDLMPTTSSQQILTCLNENESEAAKVQDEIVEDNRATKATGDSIKEYKVSNSETTTVVPSSVQLEDANTPKSTDKYSLVTQRTRNSRSYSDFDEEVNDPDAPVALKSSTPNEAMNTETEYNMVEDNLSGDTTCGAAKIEDMETNSNPDALIILPDSAQKIVVYTEKHSSGDNNDISTNVICDSDKVEDIGEVINSPELPAVSLSTIQNEKEDSKLQNENDKENLGTKVTSDTEAESAKFKCNVHIDLANDSDDEESNILHKFHLGDELLLSSYSEAGSSNESHAISNSSQSGSDNEHDVISIENSSYSETESIIDDSFSKEKNTSSAVTYDLAEESQEGDHETNIDECYENILLGSSEDEDEDCSNKDLPLSKCSGNYINLKDDDISISETELIKVTPTNYHIDEIRDCETSQSIENLCDENSNNSVKIINNDYLKTSSGEVILEDD